MAGSINKPRKPISKRTTVRLRHKIEKRSIAKQRKLRKEAKNSAQWKSKHPKYLGIPNSYPFKEQLLDEFEQAGLRKQEEARKKKEAARAARAAGTGDGDQDDERTDDVEDFDVEDLSDDGGDNDDVEMTEGTDGGDESANPMAALLASARAAAEKYQQELEGGDETDDDGEDVGTEAAVTQTSSRKQYDKVFKQVVDQADVVLYVLDARNPEGTRSREVERSVIAAASGGKRLILVLNKIDLVPPAVLRGWLAHLRRFFPTLPLRASTSAPSATTFSHGELTPQRTAASLFQALKAFAAGRNLRRAISVGVVGYPNVGKSSVINALLGRLGGASAKGGRASARACPAGAEAGVTTSIRAVKIDSKLTLLDSPGIVFPSAPGNLVSLKSATEVHANLVLLNAVPPKQMDDPVPAISLLLRRLSASQGLLDKLIQLYGLPPLLAAEGGDVTTDFLVQVARKTGRLRRGGVPNVTAAAVTVLNDWRDGRIQGWIEAPALVVAGAGGDAEAEAAGGAAEGAGPDEKIIVTEWAKEFKIEGLWGDGSNEDGDGMEV